MHLHYSFLCRSFLYFLSYIVGVSRKDLQEINNMNRKVSELMNKQVSNELKSAYLYLEFSNFFDSRNLDGYANYYRVQAKEEIDHAMLIYDYLHKANQQVKLMVIEAPDDDYKTIEDILDAGLKAEQNVTEMINAIFKTANDTDDIASKVFIKWFISEQFNEEYEAQKMIDEYKLYKDNLYELNKKYLERKHEKIVMQ